MAEYDIADDFYSLPPRCRTKVRLRELIEQQLAEAYKKGFIDGGIQQINDGQRG